MYALGDKPGALVARLAPEIAAILPALLPEVLTVLGAVEPIVTKRASQIVFTKGRLDETGSQDKGHRGEDNSRKARGELRLATIGLARSGQGLPLHGCWPRRAID